MRKFYLALIALFFQLCSFSQTDISVGSGGTTGNTGLSYPCPLQDYYEGSRMQYLYLASELTSAGMTPGNISAIKYNVISLNTFSGTVEQFKMSIGSTCTSSLTTAYWEGGLTPVYGPIDLVPVIGNNTLTLTTPFYWNGTDNILIEICNGDPNNANSVTYTQNPTIAWTTGLSFNGSHTNRSDNLGNLCGTGTTLQNGDTTTRPDITFTWAASTTGCFLPTCAAITNITSTSATATWNAPTVGTAPASYNYEVRTSGAPGSGSTGLALSGSSPTVTANLTPLTPATTYYFYVQSNCGTGNTSLWSGAYQFVTSCAAITAFSENFDGVTAPALPICWSPILRGSTIGTAAYARTVNTNSYSTPNAVVMYNAAATSTDDIILVSPVLSNLAIGTYQLSFYGKNSIAGNDVEVGTLDNNSGTAVFTSLETVTLTTAHQKYVVNFSAYTGTDVHIGIRRLNTTTYSYVYLDNISWELIPACVEPNNLNVLTTNPTNADVEWAAPATSTPASYEVYVSLSRTAPTGTTTPTALGIITTNTTLNTLTPATKYYFWVRSNCGTGGVSIWSGLDSFVTACVGVPAFSENFDGVTTPNLPTCWGKILRGATLSAFATVTTTAANAYSAPNAVTMYNSNSTATDDIILSTAPVSNLAAGTYQLSFYGKTSLVGNDVEVGTLDNNTATATFTSLQTVTLTTAHQKFVVDFSTYTGTDTYIALRRLNTTTYSYVYLDNISWELIPSCVEPNTLNVLNTTTTTANVEWAAPATSTPASYEVYVNTLRTTPTGTSTPTATGIITTNTTLNTLTPATKYYFWVRSNCGTGGVSVWSGIDSFTTACIGVPSISENFDGVTTPNLPTCWGKILRGATLSAFATINTTGANAYSTPNAVAMYNSNSTSTDDIILTTAPVSNLAAGTYQLSFYGKTSLAGNDVEIGTLDNNTANAVFTPLQTVTLTTTHQKYSVSFAGYTGTDVYIGMRRLNTTTYSYVYLDNVSWELIPSCNEPTSLIHSNLTITSGQIDWTAPVIGTPASYDVYYSISNVSPTGTTTPNATVITGTTYNMTSLTASTKYFVWVRSNCGATNGLSSWSSADSFYTPCNATNVPYIQNFETSTVPGLPICTANENIGIGNNWITANAPGSGFTSKTLEYLYNFANPADVWFYTQGLNLTAGTSYRLTFKYGNNSTTYIESMNVSYGSSPSSGNMTNLIVDYPAITAINVTPALSSTDFTPSATGVYYIGFHAYSIANQFNLFVDDITVDISPLCEAPTAVISSNITTTTAQIDWTAPTVGSPASYDVYSNSSNAAPTGTTIPTATGITGTTYNLTGLSASTKYFVWVRSNCGTNGYSAWSVADSFYTVCDSTGVPYSQNFETATVPSLPACTASENLGTGNNWVTVFNPGNGFTTKTLKYGYNLANPADAWYYTQGLSLIGGTSYRLTFTYGNNSTTYIESMNVSYGNAANAAAMTNAIIDYPSITGGVSAASVTDFTPASSGIYYIGFHAYSIANQFNLYVDDVNVTLTSASPVMLVNFAGERQGAKNMLTWNTATEQNNRGFELQRSANGTGFSTITFVASKAINGNSTSSLLYGFADEKPFAGNNYYRLKQVDKDGKATLSQVVLIKGTNVNSMVLSSVYPNPAKNLLNVVLTAPVSEKISLVVMDVAGKVLMQQTRQVTTGDNNLQLNVANLLGGTYLIKVVCTNGCETAVSKFAKE